MLQELDASKLESAKKVIDDEIKANKVILYMKGNKMAPQCGFSGQVIQILTHTGVAFETRDVLGNCLEYSLNSERKSGKFGIFRM